MGGRSLTAGSEPPEHDSVRAVAVRMLLAQWRANGDWPAIPDAVGGVAVVADDTQCMAESLHDSAVVAGWKNAKPAGWVRLATLTKDLGSGRELLWRRWLAPIPGTDGRFWTTTDGHVMVPDGADGAGMSPGDSGGCIPYPISGVRLACPGMRPLNIRRESDGWWRIRVRARCSSGIERQLRLHCVDVVGQTWGRSDIDLFSADARSNDEAASSAASVAARLWDDSENSGQPRWMSCDHMFWTARLASLCSIRDPNAGIQSTSALCQAAHHLFTICAAKAELHNV
jgi:hypothetical protein